MGFHICLQSNPGLNVQLSSITPPSAHFFFEFSLLIEERTELQKVILARAQCAPVAKSEDNVRVIYKQKKHKWANLKITTF